MNITQDILYISLYSMIGWACESIYCSILEKRPINRGFLTGPYCPIYGFGGFFILLFTEPLIAWPPLVFLMGMLAASVLEYVTSYAMEKIFAMRWWDYSDQKFNINGRVCLKNALMFGVMGIAMVYFLHPLALDLLEKLTIDQQQLLVAVVIAIFLADLLHSLSATLKLSERLRNIENLMDELRASNEEYHWLDVADMKGSIERLRDIVAQNETDAALVALMQKFESIAGYRDTAYRMLTAYPKMKKKDFDAAVEGLRESWRITIKERMAEISAQPRQKARDIREGMRKTREEALEMAQGFDPAKMVLVFTIASVIGYIVESIFCLIVNGEIESRQGMLYGPFNQIYGLGALVMLVVLIPLARKSDRWLFLGSALLGGAFEFACSWIQEGVFGSVSWEYSEYAFSLGGRTNLTYMFFWGILGVLFIKGIYPKVDALVNRIHPKQTTFLATVLLIFFVLNATVSAAAVSRWSARQDGVPPSNAVEEFLDVQYNDDYLREIYPHMHFDAPERRERAKEKQATESL